MPIDIPSMDLPHDSRRRAPAFHRTRLLGPSLLAACTALIALPSLSQTAINVLLAFPGAVGWAAHTPGGRGGQV
ncbi:MAG: hypothetical protein JWO04_867, partial [Gammaproteobacteria bacterium]|nr:hypothetical protein [Gammaproteobacteria bacterium]